MFVRGVVFGMSVISCLLAWLTLSRAQTATAPLIEIPLTHCDPTVVSQRCASVLAHIESDSPWILKPSVKPSINS
jgi:hypothetical protein